MLCYNVDFQIQDIETYKFHLLEPSLEEKIKGL